jgi:hypothetical protein
MRYQYKRRKVNPLLPLVSPDFFSAEFLFGGKVYPVPVCTLILKPDGDAYMEFTCLDGHEKALCRFFGRPDFRISSSELEFDMPMFEHWDPPWPVQTAVIRFGLTEKGLAALA